MQYFVKTSEVMFVKILVLENHKIILFILQ